MMRYMGDADSSRVRERHPSLGRRGHLSRRNSVPCRETCEPFAANAASFVERPAASSLGNGSLFPRLRRRFSRATRQLQRSLSLGEASRPATRAARLASLVGDPSAARPSRRLSGPLFSTGLISRQAASFTAQRPQRSLLTIRRTPRRSSFLVGEAFLATPRFLRGPSFGNDASRERFSR